MTWKDREEKEKEWKGVECSYFMPRLFVFVWGDDKACIYLWKLKELSGYNLYGKTKPL